MWKYFETTVEESVTTFQAEEIGSQPNVTQPIAPFTPARLSELLLTAVEGKNPSEVYTFNYCVIRIMGTS